MKAVKIAALFTILLLSTTANAQGDASLASQRALVYADSLLDAFRYSQWNQYIDLSYPGVIKYYGGRKGFESYVQRARVMNKTLSTEEKEKVEIIQILNDISEWQCVARKTRETVIDNKKAQVITYLVGQSKDEGQTWKYFDVAYNSVENVIYIMPDIFDSLSIPQRQVIFEKSDMARN